MRTARPEILKTRRGDIRLPAYIPVTTFGKKYPLDDLVRPYLPRLATAVMVSFHYAKQATSWPNLPTMIDSGGFASLFANARVFAEGDLGCIEVTPAEGAPEKIHPKDVLEFQEQHADIAFTLDFPIPPLMPLREAKRRQALTIKNARWALANRRRTDMLLFAVIQGWDEESFVRCAKVLATLPFDGFAIGGLVPRIRDEALILGITEGVRSAVDDKPLHVFGVGKPALVQRLFKLGIDSVDSSSYVKLAADGRLWGSSKRLSHPSPTGRLHLALCNLATASNAPLPLSMASMLFRTSFTAASEVR